MSHVSLITAVLISLHAAGDPSRAEDAKTIRSAVETLDAISFTVGFEARAKKKGGKRPLPKFVPLTLKVLMADGAKFRVEVYNKDRRESVIVSDGRNVTEWNAEGNTWTQYPARLFDKDYSFCRRLPRACWIDGFCTSWVDEAGPFGEWLETVITDPSTERMKDEVIDGRPCDVFSSFSDEAGLSPVPYSLKERFTLCVDKTTHLPVRESEGQKIVSFLYNSAFAKQIDFRELVANPKVPANAFTFTPPKDSTFISPDDPKLRPKELVALTGKPAPAFSLPSVEGKAITLADFKDRSVVLLVFWGTWCLPCQKEIPTLVKLHEELGDKGLAVIGVCGGEPLKKVKKFLKSRPLPYLILHDAKQKATQAYGASAVPYTLLINKDGIVVCTWRGWEGGQEEKELREEIGKLLGEG